MAIPLDESMTPSLGAQANQRPKSEEPISQDQARTNKKRSRILLRRCVWLFGGLLLAGGVVWGVQMVRREIAAHAAEQNFRKVTQALLDHAEDHGQVLPTQAIYDKHTGKPLLSWRVAILPQLGEEALYKEIYLDEPWDSPHNRQFWDRMPKAYELPGLPASGGRTAIQVFTGPDTPFDGREGRKYPQGFPDGTSVTILIAEAAVPVNWMKPQDIDMNKVDPEDIRASLSNRTGKGPLIALAHGRVLYFPEKYPNWSLKAAITPAGNDLIEITGW